MKLSSIGDHEGEGESDISKLANQLEHKTLEDREKDEEAEEGVSEAPTASLFVSKFCFCVD